MGPSTEFVDERGLRRITGADGRFSAPLTQSGPIHVRLAADGYQPATVRAVVPDGVMKHDLGPTQLRWGVILEGWVLDHEGAPIEGAEFVEVDDDWALMWRGHVLGRSGPNGQFSLEGLQVGDYKLIVSAPGHPPGFVEGAIFQAGRQPPREIRLPRGGSIRGVVRATPEDLTSGQLRVFASCIEDALDMPPGLRSRQLFQHVEVQRSGQFELDGLVLGPDPTEYSLRVVARGGTIRSLSETAVHAHVGDSGVELLVHSSSRVRVTVVDEMGAHPLPKCEFRYLDQVGNEFPLTARLTDAQYIIEGFRPIPPGPGKILIAHEGYRGCVLPIPSVLPGQEHDAGTVTLAPGPTVRVRVIDKHSTTPIEGAKVRMFCKSAPFVSQLPVSDGVVQIVQRETIALTNSAGEALVEIPRQRPFTLAVTAAGYAPSLPEAVDPLAVPGEWLVALEGGARVAVRVRNGRGEAWVGAEVQHRIHSPPRNRALDPLYPPARSVFTGTDGLAAFENCGVGSHEFRVRDPLNPRHPSPWKLLEVRDGATHEMLLQWDGGTTLEGRVTASGEPLANAQMRLSAVRPDGRVWDTSTNDEGMFRLSNLGAGPHWLDISHISLACTSRGAITLQPGKNSQDWALSLRLLDGIVTDEGGEGLPGARVVVGTRSRVESFISSPQGTTGSAKGTTVTDGSGRFRLSAIPDSGEMWIGVSALNHETYSAALQQPIGDEVLRVTLGPAGAANVSLSGPPEPFAPLLVIAEPMNGKGAQRGSFLGKGSTWSLTDLSPGNWEFRVLDFPDGVLSTEVVEIEPLETIDIVLSW